MARRLCGFKSRKVNHSTFILNVWKSAIIRNKLKYGKTNASTNENYSNIAFTINGKYTFQTPNNELGERKKFHVHYYARAQRSYHIWIWFDFYFRFLIFIYDKPMIS